MVSRPALGGAFAPLDVSVPFIAAAGISLASIAASTAFGSALARPALMSAFSMTAGAIAGCRNGHCASARFTHQRRRPNYRRPSTQTQNYPMECVDGPCLSSQVRWQRCFSRAPKCMFDPLQE
jgi:hypothetical protein